MNFITYVKLINKYIRHVRNALDRDKAGRVPSRSLPEAIWYQMSYATCPTNKEDGIKPPVLL